MAQNVTWIQPLRPIFIDAPARAARATAPRENIPHHHARDVSADVARIRAMLLIERSGQRLEELRDRRQA